MTQFAHIYSFFRTEEENGKVLHVFDIFLRYCGGCWISIVSREGIKAFKTINEFYMGRLTNGKRGRGGLKNESFERFLNDTRTLNNERWIVRFKAF